MVVFFRNGITKLLFWFLFLTLVFSHAIADTIYFKDGSITVCRDRAWEEDGQVKCEFYGTVVAYPTGEVDRIETGDRKVATPETGSIEKQNREREKGKAESSADPARTPPPKNTGIKRSDGPLFYDPRRPRKYWASETSRYDTLSDAIAALARQFNRTPEWVKAHMGATNDLRAIHRNLSSESPVSTEPEKKQPVPDRPDAQKLEGIKFYDPRRPNKYWTSEASHHATLGRAIDVLARQYGRSPQWIKAHLGETNDLGKIHRNLSRALSEEEGR